MCHKFNIVVDITMLLENLPRCLKTSWIVDTCGADTLGLRTDSDPGRCGDILLGMYSFVDTWWGRDTGLDDIREPGGGDDTMLGTCR